jgi:hypothetical protein
MQKELFLGRERMIESVNTAKIRRKTVRESSKPSHIPEKWTNVGKVHEGIIQINDEQSMPLNSNRMQRLFANVALFLNDGNEYLL